METFEELKNWVDSLSVAEKRFVKLLGKARAGTGESQQLKLLDWLNRTQDHGQESENQEFRKNLPTVSMRLKDLILDSLRLMHKEDNTEAMLRTTLDEIAVLHLKKLHRTVTKQLRRTKKLAMDTSRYSYAFQCIEWERKIAQLASTGNTQEVLESLRKEEIAILKMMSDLCDLQHRHDTVLAIMRQSLFRRDPKKAEEINALANPEVIHLLCASNGYVERALAINILGLRDLNERNSKEALLRYQGLLSEWRTKPVWQKDQSPLLLLICKLYQTACFFRPVNWEEAREYIEMAGNFKGLAQDDARDFKRMLYHNEFTLALNSSKLDVAKKLIPEIEQWIKQENAHLTEVQVLPFLCNFAVAEFLTENYAAANRFVLRILNMPNRNIRKDIRGFALVLQALIQFELKNTELNESLARAGKRQFDSDTLETNFELIVFRFLERAIRHDKQEDKSRLIDQLVQDLEKLQESVAGQIPILGLNEVHMWATSKQTGQPLCEVFLEVLRRTQESSQETE